MPRFDIRRLGTLTLSVVAATISFFVVYQFTYFFSLSGVLALTLAATCAFFIYNYIPSFSLARLDPHVLHPEPRPYRLSKADALAHVRSELTRHYFAGRSWTYRECDSTTIHELIFTCKLQEQDVSDKGPVVTDIELQLLVQAVSVQGNCVIQLDYQLSEPRPSIAAKDLAEATTAHIEAALFQLQEVKQ